jgi:hypothetical protein
MRQAVSTIMALLGGVAGFAATILFGLPLLELDDAPHRADAVGALLGGTMIGVVLSLALVLAWQALAAACPSRGG